MSEKNGLEVATLGGGCFWCLEAAFEQLRGVEKVESGYAGGTVPNPTYKAVCSGTTGHAEMIQVTFDPAVIAYRELLEVFFVVHDPTTLNRQGNDVGTQYRSVVFYHSPEQKQTAEAVIRELTEQGVWPRPVVTEVAPALLPEQSRAAVLPAGREREGGEGAEGVRLEAEDVMTRLC
jgi:peptide-methionine (S)-S-oxide reductase